MKNSILEWSVILPVVGYGLYLVLVYFEPYTLIKYVSLFDGSMRPGEMYVPYAYATRAAVAMSLAGFYVAPVVLAIRMCRKEFFGQSITFYFGERLWYCGSIVIVFMTLLMPHLGILFFVPMSIIFLVTIGYFCMLLNAKKFYCSIDGFGVLCILTLCISYPVLFFQEV